MSRILTTSLLGFVLFSLFFLLAPTVHADITTGLVGHWTFDEGSGTTAGDSSGNGNTGMFVNGPTWTQGKVGSGALSFDGADDSIEISGTGLDNNDTFTWALWYKRGATGRMGLIDKGDDGSGIKLLEFTSANQLRIRVRGSTGNADSHTGSYTDTNWHHLAATYDDNGDRLARLYLDGTLILTTGALSGTIDDDSIDSMRIAREESGGRFFNGQMDDVRVYSRALGVSDIAELYAYTGGGSPPPPTPVNGTCGSTQNSCISGTLNDTTDSATNYLWQCVGSNSGTTASCSLPIPTTPTNYTLTVSKNGTGSGTVSGTGISCGTDCSETVNSGTNITLTAIPASGSTFAGWSGACSGTGSCTTTLSTNRSVTATFNTTSTTPPPEGGTTVSNASEFSTALASATGGIIYLNPGNYGALNLTGRTFASTVTLKSANTNNKAVFSSMSLSNVKNLTLDSIHLYHPTSDTRRPFDIKSASDNVVIKNSLIQGDYVEPASTAMYGFYIDASTNITFQSNELIDANKGVIIYQSSNITVSDNNIHHVAEDGLNCISCQNVTIRANWIHDTICDGSCTAHRDMIQGWQNGAAASNVVIENNFLDSGTGNWSQSIFWTGAKSNFTVRNNIVYNAHVNGIRLVDTVGLTIEDNTTLYNPAAANPSGSGVGDPRIYIPGATSVVLTGNIYLSNPSVDGGTISNNLLAQRTNPSGANYVGNLYLDGAAILAGGSVGLDAFIQVVGQTAYGIGANIAAIKAAATWDDGVSTTPPPPPPSTTPVNGSCGATQNACTTGTLSDTADSSTNYLWQCVGTNGGTTASCSLAKPPPPSTTFSIDDTVKANTPGSNLNVRATPNGTILGTQPNNSTGTVTSGPTYANSLWWWQINFTSGVDGWTAEDYLINYTTPPPADDGSNGGGTDGGSTSGGTTEGTTSGDTGGGTTSGGGGGSAGTTSGSPSTSSGSSSGGGGFVSTPTLSTSSGQATQDETAQLLALVNQLKTLIALLKSLGGTIDPALEAMVNAYPDSPVPSASSGATGQAFTRSLTLGSRGEDVRQLQIFLNAEGFTVSTTRGGSPGNETTYFGEKTRAAVAAFQRAHGITPPAGYFGPKTRAVVEGK